MAATAIRPTVVSCRCCGADVDWRYLRNRFPEVFDQPPGICGSCADVLRAEVLAAEAGA